MVRLAKGKVFGKLYFETLLKDLEFRRIAFMK